MRCAALFDQRCTRDPVRLAAAGLRPPLPATLTRVLDEGKFEVDPAIRTWKDRGWLLCSKGRNHRKVKIGREQAWVVAVTRKGLEEAGAV